MTTIKQLTFRKTVKPMRTLFATSLGQKNAATSVLISITLSDGQKVCGEVPTSFVMPHETVANICSILKEARGELVDLNVDNYEAVLAGLRRRFGNFHMTLAGLEVALFRASLASRGRRELAHWGGKCSSIQTDITIPFIPDGQMLADWLGRVMKVGFVTYKIKVSGDIERDMQFLRSIREILSGSLGRYIIRLDGNQGYTSKSYLKMLDLLARERMEIELFEQPLKKDDYSGLKAIRGRSAVPVVLDETVFCSADCRRVIEDDLGDGVNIKIAKSGIAESAAILKLARKAGKKLMIGCMTETMVGLSAGIYLAAGTGSFDYVDLDSVHLLATRSRGDIAVRGSCFMLSEAGQ